MDITKDLEASKEASVLFIHAKYGFETYLETEYFILEFSELSSFIEGYLIDKKGAIPFFTVLFMI